MDDKLHAAAFIEEPFGDDCVLIWQGSQGNSAGANVENSLLSPKAIEPAFAHEPCGGFLFLFDRVPNPAHFFRQFERTAGSLAAPEGNRWRRTVRILDANTPGFDTS